MKYRKKPIEVEAFQWTGGPDQTEDPDWIIEAIKKGTVTFVDWGQMRIVSSEVYYALPGYYIVYDGQEIYACSPEVFSKTYEAVD